MKKINKKSLLLLIAVVVMLVMAIGGTVAYLAASTPELVNTFSPSTVTTEITDKVENSVKKDVTIKNTSSIPVYMRVAVVANWYDDNGNIVAPWSDYSGLGVDSDKWTLSGVYYYYNGTVAAGDSVVLFTSYTQPTPPVSGAHLEMDILAQVIQSEGIGATTAQQAFAKAVSGN